MGITDSYTVKVIESNGFCDFDVSDLQTGPGDEVTFINKTDKPISISFYKSDFFKVAFLNLLPGDQATVTMASDCQDELCECSLNCDTNVKIVFKTTMPRLVVHRK